jgi:DNA-3-methyladenine glycosylase II
LSGKAAATIHGRFLDLFPEAYPFPEALLALDLPTLRSAGLSRQKATYIQNVAEFFQRENLIGKDLADMDDETVIRYLTQIKGVGRWTVEMLLMFTLNRPDVLPLDDLGIQQAMQLLYNFEEKGRALKKRMLELAEPWRPYRTYASLYLWRWKDSGGV